MASEPLADLSVAEAARRIRDGVLTSEELVGACLDRCAELEPRVGAWAWLDPAQALAQACAADALRDRGRPLGPLHGLPVGIKDIFDTADMPTENGTVLHAGRRPAEDAAVVARLRAAGAVILGKTITTEMATYAPSRTRNPHRLTHTPGGSSSGSAAAVAAGMVPLALGSQTNGSVIRPAAFCGVVGFKPSYGLISRHGVLKLAGSLDQVGVFASSVEDAALAVDALLGADPRDPATVGAATGTSLRQQMAQTRATPRLGFVKTPMWPRAEPTTRRLFAALARTLGASLREIELPGVGEEAFEAHRCIMEAEMAFNLEREWASRAYLSASLRQQLARGRKCSARAYQQALAQARKTRLAIAEAFSRCDAILTPAAPGPAPRGLGSTGDPSFCTLWTLCGLPAIALPVGRTALGLPLAVQLVGARNEDARLLHAAEWFAKRVSVLVLRT